VADTWLTAAERLTEAARDLGFEVAATVAAAWQARCDPDATRTLVQAAHALTGGDALPRLWDRVPPCPSARGYLGDAEEHEAQACVLARQARDLEESCDGVLGDAIAGYRQARERAGKAHARLASGTPGAAAQVALDAAWDAMRAFQQVIADCEAALDVIAPARERLEYATGCLRQAPDAFAEAYAIPLQLTRDGGTLPWSGDFLTGASPRASA
jgi:hypothetical protein